ncbi:unnamed protein product [Spodoptera littoralis]|uniref:Uncharacterized protein n=1 Tax=Spodoptera littoralis TaxID=7109 RepID=A0A9P0HTV5_SPOLI|nr:unnamed protein product [Spodoptera littoralis]
MPHCLIRLVDVFIRRRSNPKSHFRRIIVGNRASLCGVALKKPLRGGDTRLCPALSGSTNVAKRLDVIVYPGNIRRCPFPGVRAGGAVRYGRFRIKLDWRGLFVPCNNSFDKLSPLTLKLATTM